MTARPGRPSIPRLERPTARALSLGDRKLGLALDALVSNCGVRQPLPADPVWLVHRYRNPHDQEIAALIAATGAYGQVDVLMRAAAQVLDALGPSPWKALQRRRHRETGFLDGFVYRWTRAEDLRQILEGVSSMADAHGGLGEALSHHAARAGGLEEGFRRWVEELRAPAASLGPLSRGVRFLLADPAQASACKRWRLFLRWMVRGPDAIDPGTWSGRFDPGELIVPLDAHWTRIAPRLGLSRLRTPGRRMALEITARLRRLRPSDPLAYDFALCHLGIAGGCPPRLTRADCARCPLAEVCPTGVRRLRAAGPVGVLERSLPLR